MFFVTSAINLAVKWKNHLFYPLLSNLVFISLILCEKEGSHLCCQIFRDCRMCALQLRSSVPLTRMLRLLEALVNRPRTSLSNPLCCLRDVHILQSRQQAQIRECILLPPFRARHSLITLMGGALFSALINSSFSLCVHMFMCWTDSTLLLGLTPWFCSPCSSSRVAS